MSILDRLFKKPVDYVEGRVGEVRSQLREDASDALATLSILLIVAIIAGVSLLLLSIALSIAIGQAIGMIWGYLIVGGLYGLGAFLFWRYYQKPENKMRLKKRIHAAITPEEKPIEPETLTEDKDYPLEY